MNKFVQLQEPFFEPDPFDLAHHVVLTLEVNQRQLSRILIQLSLPRGQSLFSKLGCVWGSLFLHQPSGEINEKYNIKRTHFILLLIKLTNSIISIFWGLVAQIKSLAHPWFMDHKRQPPSLHGNFLHIHLRWMDLQGLPFRIELHFLDSLRQISSHTVLPDHCKVLPRV